MWRIGHDEHRILPDKYENHVEAMLHKTKPVVQVILLLTPYYMEPNSTDSMRARMGDYCAIFRQLAEKNGCILMDFKDLYERFVSIRHFSSIVWGRVRPNQRWALQ